MKNIHAEYSSIKNCIDVGVLLTNIVNDSVLDHEFHSFLSHIYYKNEQNFLS